MKVASRDATWCRFPRHGGVVLHSVLPDGSAACNQSIALDLVGAFDVDLAEIRDLCGNPACVRERTQATCRAKEEE
jgi:hypothetical protein